MSKPNNLINDRPSIMNYLKTIQKPYILGFYLVGSRGRGTNREDSDWDIYVQTKVPVVNFNGTYGRKHGYNIDFSTGLEPKGKLIVI